MSENEEVFTEIKEKSTLFTSFFKFLYEPSKHFPIIVKRRLWVWFPIILIFFSTCLSTYTFFSKVDREAFILKQLSQTKFTQNMTKDEINKIVENFKKKSALVEGLIGSTFYIVWLLFASLVYYFSFLLLGGVAKYIEVLIVVFWSEVALTFATILSILVMLFKRGDEILNPNEIVLSNLGAIIGSERLSPFLFALLSSIDIFAIWNLILLTFGLSYVSKIERKYSAFIVFSLYILKVLLKSAWIYIVT